MVELKCIMCGGKLNVKEGDSVIECEYCGTKQTVTVPTAITTTNVNETSKNSGISKAIIFSAIGCVLTLLIIIIALIVGDNGFNFENYDDSSQNTIVKFEENNSSVLSQFESNDNMTENSSSSITGNVIIENQVPSQPTQENFNSSQVIVNSSQNTTNSSQNTTNSSQDTTNSSQDTTNSSQDTTSSSPAWSVKQVTGGVEISGIGTYNNSGVYNIPREIDGKMVVGIGDQAFYYESNLKNVTLPDTITYIGEQAFANCRSLTEISIPASVTEIGNNAFMSCTSLSKVYIKSSNIHIHIYAFSSSYQQNIPLTIYAPANVITQYRFYFDAQWIEWNG